MATIGLFVSSEEHSGSFLVDSAKKAEQAGLTHLLVSDHFHPWLEEQGHSPFVWSVLGAMATSTGLTLTTGVTCPTIRMHPALNAQAAATVAELAPGRFRFGVGSGEMLNEHILGDRWPVASVRLEMLDEAIGLIRQLWSGEMTTFHGKHYTVEDAKIYEAPSEPIPVLVSGFGPKAIDLAARTGDGFVTVQPDEEGLGQYRSAGGKGIAVGALKCLWGSDRDAAVKEAHRLWRNESTPGELVTALATPELFAQATQLVTPEMVGDALPAGPDPDEYVKAIKAYIDAGFDEIYIQQMGDDLDGFLGFFNAEVLPALPAT